MALHATTSHNATTHNYNTGYEPTSHNATTHNYNIGKESTLHNDMYKELTTVLTGHISGISCIFIIPKCLVNINIIDIFVHNLNRITFLIRKV